MYVPLTKKKIFHDAQSVGLEPTLPEGIWFLVRRLNHSATTAWYWKWLYFLISKLVYTICQGLVRIVYGCIFIGGVNNYNKQITFSAASILLILVRKKFSWQYQHLLYSLCVYIIWELNPSKIEVRIQTWIIFRTVPWTLEERIGRFHVYKFF